MLQAIKISYPIWLWGPPRQTVRFWSLMVTYPNSKGALRVEALRNTLFWLEVLASCKCVSLSISWTLLTGPKRDMNLLSLKCSPSSSLLGSKKKTSCLPRYLDSKVLTFQKSLLSRKHPVCCNGTQDIPWLSISITSRFQRGAWISRLECAFTTTTSKQKAIS
jgi:hypothetical protein